MLASCVELQDVATRSDLAVLARYASDPDEQAELDWPSSGDDDEGKAAYREQVARPAQVRARSAR